MAVGLSKARLGDSLTIRLIQDRMGNSTNLLESPSRKSSRGPLTRCRIENQDLSSDEFIFRMCAELSWGLGVIPQTVRLPVHPPDDHRNPIDVLADRGTD